MHRPKNPTATGAIPLPALPKTLGPEILRSLVAPAPTISLATRTEHIIIRSAVQHLNALKGAHTLPRVTKSNSQLPAFVTAFGPATLGGRQKRNRLIAMSN
eukprot:1179784-Prorocentrum_minimum.AAC.8